MWVRFAVLKLQKQNSAKLFLYKNRNIVEQQQKSCVRVADKARPIARQAGGQAGGRWLGLSGEMGR